MLKFLVGGSLVLILVAAVLKFSDGRKPFEPAAGSAWVEPSTGMQFVWVPSGCFNMGSEALEDDQKPVHRVCVKGFYLGKYEVTQRQYEKIVGSNPCSQKCIPYLGPDRAVTGVRWEEATRMAEALGSSSGNQFRLPSEAEWEYACVAGGQHKVNCGDGRHDDLGWMQQHRYGPKSNRPQDVGGKKPNAWGLFDMTGNVSEYVQDCWHGNYSGAPKDGSAWMTDGDCFARLYRGGSWGSGYFPTATTRVHIEFDGDPGNWEYSGFRLVKTQ